MIRISFGGQSTAAASFRARLNGIDVRLEGRDGEPLEQYAARLASAINIRLAPPSWDFRELDVLASDNGISIRARQHDPAAGAPTPPSFAYQVEGLTAVVTIQPSAKL